MRTTVFALLTLLPGLAAVPRVPADDPPRILIVTAHPDDEAMFAATVWRAAREHGAHVDLALITNGAGGYRFSTLAEPLYGLRLTDPDVASTHLPAIRKKELMAGGDIVGLRNYFFLDEPDTGRFLDVDSVFTHLWNVPRATERLREVLLEGDYDLVLTFVPVPETHAHHKGAAILALEAVASLPVGGRPGIVGSTIGEGAGAIDFSQLGSHVLTRLADNPTPYVMDREQPLGLDGRLNYQIVANWLIAEHKSQGTMQTYMSAGRFERFWPFALNETSAMNRIRDTMAAIGVPYGSER